MNRSIFIGNLVRDPEMRTTANDHKVCSFSIACNRRFKNADGQRVADFIPVTVWGSLAETCFKYLTKGRRVAVSGRIETSRYTRDDEVRYSFSLVADEVEFVSPMPGKADEPQEDMVPVQEDGGVLFEDEIPNEPVDRNTNAEVTNFLDAIPDTETARDVAYRGNAAVYEKRSNNSKDEQQRRAAAFARRNK